MYGCCRRCYETTGSTCRVVLEFLCLIFEEKSGLYCNAMRGRALPASPNWYCSRCSDVSSGGLLGVGAKNVIYLIDVTASSCVVSGELLGHRDMVSGVSFCHHQGQSHVCVSSSSDGSVRFWDTERRSLIREHANHQSAVSAVHWSPADRNLVVSGDEKGVVTCHWFHSQDTTSFFPEPRTIVCLSCSTHLWNLSAIGYKDGMIVVIDLSKKGAVLHRLRGHDDEVHSLAWAPVEGEDVVSGSSQEATDSATAGSPSPDGGTGFYLASGSRDHTLRVWSTARGKSVTTMKLPHLKRRGAVEPGLKERLWLTVHWPPGRTTQLLSSSSSGDLLMWDTSRSSKQRYTVLGSASEQQSHSRMVFNLCSLTLKDGRQLLLSTSMDRQIKCWDLDSLDCVWTLPTLGGFVYALSFSPVATGSLALGVGDNMIRVWDTLATHNQYHIRCYWQSIKSKVTALCWSPVKEGRLAFGTDDGKVGIYEVFSNRPPQISSSYHRRTVYSLAWGPLLPPPTSGATGGAVSLYSCSGDGTILQHDPNRPNHDATDIDKLIKDSNGITHKLSPHTDLSWKPDWTVVAIGNEDGSVHVYEASALRQLCSIQQHHKTINALSWNRCLLASGSNNATVYVHDLSNVLENPPERVCVLTEPFCRLEGHTAKITGLSWSPHHHSRLVSTSYDGTAQVWDVMEETAVCNYRGHMGSVLSVDWSPVDPDVVWTGGKDFTVQQWNVSQQEFNKPPKGKKMIQLKEKNKNNLKKKSQSQSEVPATNGDKDSLEEEEEKKDEEAVLPELHRKPSSVRTKDKPDLSSQKKKKPRAMLPISTSMDHMTRDALLQDCITLASLTHTQAPPVGCVPGHGEHIHLGLFTDGAALKRMFQAEEEAHLQASHCDSVVYLRLWSGDLQGALQLATERGELSDHLLSIAPMAGYQVWTETVEAFIKQLCVQQQYLKAASHLLSINKLNQAVELLRSQRLYREAVSLVKMRLAPDSSLLKELYCDWAAVLEKDGHLSAAAKCFLAAGLGFEAAKVLSKKSDMASLQTAAEVARLVGEEELCRSLSLRCVKELMEARDWLGAHGVLGLDEQLKAHRLHLSVAELLSVKLDTPTPMPSEDGVRLQDRVMEVWAKHYEVGESTSVGHFLLELRSSEYTASRSTSLKEVLLLSSLHVTCAVLAWISNDHDLLLMSLYYSVCGEMCRRLFPDGDVGVFSSRHSERLHPCGEGSQCAALSLQAVVTYHRLYEQWWRTCNSPLMDQELWESHVSLLLSEPHAACQVALRAEAELTQRLSVLVQQHSSRASQSAEEPSSFLSLSSALSKHQKELSEFPKSLKAFPRPDVLECSLLLLHLNVSDAIQRDAKNLLRTYGDTRPDILRASRCFLT
ncbi:gem-associated protein 5 [Gouania willdenowi]|uniref:gem-associated protein 5 n=1 Tax=Gouania willdenowi TaxID=441366 RepID=UPI00105435D6|nr:gem-associated protein 5 [Gouania willdenowi]